MIDPINSADFSEKVLQASGKVLVDFSATWCGPCKALEPVFEEVVASLGDEVSAYKVDVDESMDIALSYKVMSVPTIILFEDGRESGQLVGLHSAPEIEALVRG